MLLRQKGYEEFLPVYTPRRAAWQKPVAEQPLFPGYLFCRVTDQVAGRIVTTPGVIRIVGVGNRPEPVCDQEMEQLQRVVASGLGLSAWSRLERGQRVSIDAGPLRGCEGVFLRIHGEEHLVVSMTLLQRSVAVKIPGDWVVPVAPSRPVVLAPAPAFLHHHRQAHGAPIRAGGRPSHEPPRRINGMREIGRAPDERLGEAAIPKRLTATS